MQKSIGLKKIKVAVFISGTGTNLKNLIKFSLSPGSPIKVALVVSNNSNALGLNYIKKYKIKKKFINLEILVRKKI